jgi:hypothetical protein
MKETPTGMITANTSFDLVSEHAFPIQSLLRAMSSSALQVSTTTSSSSSASSSMMAGPATTFPTTMPLSVPNTITVRLDRTNFLLWKTQVVPNIADHGWLGFLDGSCAALPKTITTGAGADTTVADNPAYALWWYTDQRVMSILLGNMTEDILGQMIGRDTSMAVWACVTAMFSAQNRTGVRQLRRQLTSLKKNDLSASDYFNKMKGFADALATVGYPVTDDELIDYIVVGLGTQFEALQSSMTVLSATNAVITLSDFYAMLLNCESIQEQNKQVGDFSTSANVVRRLDTGRGGDRPFDSISGGNGGRPGGRPYNGQQGGGNTGPSGGGQQGNRGPRNGGGGVTATTDKVVAAEVVAAIVHSARFVATGGMAHSAAGTATTRCIKRMINAPGTPPPHTMMISSHGSWTPVPPTTSPTTWVS